MHAEQTNIEAYKAYVSFLAQNKSDELISNGSIEHAAITIANFLLHAEKEIRIFSSELMSAIYEDEYVIKSLKYFLSKEQAGIRIILQSANADLDELMKKHDFLKICLEAHGDKCYIARASTKDSQIKEHFVIMDMVGYRFCPDHTYHKAVATFNQPDAAENLATQFDTIFKRSDIVHQPSNKVKVRQLSQILEELTGSTELDVASLKNLIGSIQKDRISSSMI